MSTVVELRRETAFLVGDMLQGFELALFFGTRWYRWHGRCGFRSAFWRQRANGGTRSDSASNSFPNAACGAPTRSTTGRLIFRCREQLHVRRAPRPQGRLPRCLRPYQRATHLEGISSAIQTPRRIA